MKKFWIITLLTLFVSFTADAVNMVEIQSYLNKPVRVVGLPDFPPFSYYDNNENGKSEFHSIFKNALKKALDKHNVIMEEYDATKEEIDNVKLLLVKAKSGETDAFIGAYADTRLFSGLDIIYPAVIYNPIHVITLEDTQAKIKNFGDLIEMRGIACRSEYFSDFVLRKFGEMNVRFVDTPYEAYEALITGKADYIFGSMYYNRIMASRYGVGDYLKYSKNPAWNIPFFIALSKMMPYLSEYKKILREEFENPEFATEVKQEIIDAVNEEVNKNAGVVPPSFINESEQGIDVVQDNDYENDEEEEKVSRGHIVEQETNTNQRSIDEVLEGI